MIQSSSKSSKRGGNTILLSTKKKQISPARYWCFTLNNYHKNDIEQLKKLVVPRYVFQEETGENGTPHIQGWIDYGKGRKKRPFADFDILELTKKPHFEKCKGSAAQNIAYCSKADTRTGETYMKGVTPPYKGPKISLYKWQKQIDKFLKDEPDDRTILHILGKKGNEGKTTFAKWLYHQHDRVIVLSGKGTDMKNGLLTWIQNNENKFPRTIIINIPRSSANFISWTGIEEVKDMFFYSGKYEGGMVSGPNPHLIIFANEKPPPEKMSSDRWKCYEINDETKEMHEYDCGDYEDGGTEW